MIETDLELAQLTAEAPDIPGLRFRRLRLSEDLIPLSEMANRAATADRRARVAGGLGELVRPPVRVRPGE